MGAFIFYRRDIIFKVPFMKVPWVTLGFIAGGVYLISIREYLAGAVLMFIIIAANILINIRWGDLNRH